MEKSLITLNLSPREIMLILEALSDKEEKTLRKPPYSFGSRETDLRSIRAISCAVIFQTK